jgi:hypothetical protein
MHEVCLPSDTKKVSDRGILAFSRYDLDPIPRGLKPRLCHLTGTAKDRALPKPNRATWREILQNETKRPRLASRTSTPASKLAGDPDLHPSKQACWGPRLEHSTTLLRVKAALIFLYFTDRLKAPNLIRDSLEVPRRNHRSDASKQLVTNANVWLSDITSRMVIAVRCSSRFNGKVPAPPFSILARHEARRLKRGNCPTSCKGRLFDSKALHIRMGHHSHWRG